MARVSQPPWSRGHGESRAATTKVIVHHLATEDLEAFGARVGRAPVSLEELDAWCASTTPERERPRLDDAWGRPLRYEVLANGSVRLGSFGRDGRPGGRGDDADSAWPELCTGATCCATHPLR